MGDTQTNDLGWAVKNGDKAAIEAGLKADKTLVNKVCEGGRPPLCIAADYGQLEIIEYLLDQGANVNVTDKYGITPLLSAIFEGHTDAVKLLLKKGANKEGKAPDGSSYVEAAEKAEIKELLKK